MSFLIFFFLLPCLLMDRIFTNFYSIYCCRSFYTTWSTTSTEYHSKYLLIVLDTLFSLVILLHLLSSITAIIFSVMFQSMVRKLCILWVHKLTKAQGVDQIEWCKKNYPKLIKAASLSRLHNYNRRRNLALLL